MVKKNKTEYEKIEDEMITILISQGFSKEESRKKLKEYPK